MTDITAAGLGDLGHQRALLGLTAIQNMNPRRLTLILRSHDPGDAWERLQRGPLRGAQLGGLLATEATTALGERVVADLSASATRIDGNGVIDRLMQSCADHQIRMAALGDDAYPPLLANDVDPPAVIFWRGDLSALERRRVGVVGTRNATAAGRATATELGRGLGQAGFAVVSGLARGIDGAAHRGVREVDGVAVGVVGNGLDRPYPRQNAGLWSWVAANGLLLSEWPPETEPEGWRFPLRNRIIAALSEVLTVVESRKQGGSLITVNEAIDRGVDVMAVPGSLRNVAAGGTNDLLRDGAVLLESIDDVLMQMGLCEHVQPSLPLTVTKAPDGLAARVLDEINEAPQTLAMVLERIGTPIHETALALARLERDGWVIESGGYFETTRSRLAASSPPHRGRRVPS